MNNSAFDSQFFLDEITDLVQSITLDGKFLYVNRAWRETLGYTEAEISSLHFSDIVHPASLEHCQSIFQRILNGEFKEDIETQFITKNGEILPVSGSGSCSYRDGKPFATRSVFRDVTKKILTEQKLSESEALFRAFMNSSPIVAFMKDEQGKYVYANKTLETMFRIEASSIIGETDFEWLPKDVAQMVRENDQSIISSQKSIELLEIVPTPDGATKYWSVFKFPFTDAKGQKYVGGVATDITERKEIEFELTRNHRETQTLVENSPDIIVRMDKKLRFVFVNSAFEVLFEMPKESFIGNSFHSAGLSDPSFTPALEKFQSVFDTGEETIFENQFPFAGHWRYFQIRAIPEFTEDGLIDSILIVARDTTERRNMEESLQRSEHHYRNLVEGGQGFLFTHDQSGKILTINPAVAYSLGYEVDEIVGRNLREFTPKEKSDDLDVYFKKVWLDKSADGVIPVLTRDGQEHFWKYQNVKLTETVENPFILGYAQDVTDLKFTEKQLENLTLADDLTGLYNRRGFLMLAERQLRIAHSDQRKKNVFLVFADMDGLKEINDTFGHDQGSLAIMKMSEILAGNFRGSDVIARLGGDEFVVLVVDERDETQELVVNRLQQKIKSYNALKNHEFDLSLSVGITPVLLQNPLSLELLLRRADQAMYQQKRIKKGLI